MNIMLTCDRKLPESRPAYCARCDAWPAINPGMLCDRCDDIQHANSNPVPGGNPTPLAYPERVAWDKYGSYGELSWINTPTAPARTD